MYLDRKQIVRLGIVLVAKDDRRIEQTVEKSGRGLIPSNSRMWSARYKKIRRVPD